MYLVKIDKERLRSEVKSESPPLETSLLSRMFSAYLDAGDNAFIVESEHVEGNKAFSIIHAVWLPIIVLSILSENK